MPVRACLPTWTETLSSVKNHLVKIVPNHAIQFQCTNSTCFYPLLFSYIDQFNVRQKHYRTHEQLCKPLATNGMMGRGNQMIQMRRDCLLGDMKCTTQLHKHQWKHTFLFPPTKSVFTELLKAQTHSCGEVILLCPTTSPALCHHFINRSCNALSSACSVVCLVSPSCAPEQRGLHTAGLCWPSKAHCRAAGGQAGR